MIYFFRVLPNTNPSDAAALRLLPEEFETALNGDWWRGADILPPDDPNAWWSVTEQGSELARNPSSEIKAHWFGNQ